MTSLANLEMSLDFLSIQKWSDIPKDIVPRNVPRLTPNSHKGSYGRIGVLGGNERYTGAPFYSAMAALNTGSDLAFVFCAEEAAIPLKCYSPELMVTPVYVAKEFTKALDIDGDPGEQERDRLVTKMVSEVTSMFNRMHAIIIGPGLGRCPLVMRATAIIVQKAMEASLPLVLDADALHILTLKEYRYILNSEKPKKLAVITPNIVEYNRLMKSFENISPDEEALVSEAYRDVIVVEKGFFDAIYFLSEALDTKDDPSRLFPSMICKEDGGLKRSGGLGDILSGALGLTWHGTAF